MPDGCKSAVGAVTGRREASAVAGGMHVRWLSSVSGRLGQAMQDRLWQAHALCQGITISWGSTLLLLPETL
jgi:hypothetical protein